MSFLSVLKTIGHAIVGVVNVGTTLEPIINAIPVLGPIATTIFSAVSAAEGLINVASTGPVKKSVVTAIVNAQHPGVDPTSLSAKIDEVVAAMNALAVALGTEPAAAKP